MSQLEEKNYDERADLAQNQDYDYDVYLFWPSLSNRDVSSGDPSSSPLYGPVSLHSESTDYDSSGLGTGPPSPVTFAPVLDRHFPLPVEEALDFDAALPDEPDAGPQVRREVTSAKYSAIVKMGLFFSQMTHRFDHAVEGVKLKFHKPNSTSQ